MFPAKLTVSFAVRAFAAGLFLSAYAINAQAPAAAPKSSAAPAGATKPVDSKDSGEPTNGLQRLEAIRTSERLIEDNLHAIRVLEVITANFGADKKEDLKKLKDQYILAKQDYYIGRLIPAVDALKDNQRGLGKMFAQFSQGYKDRTMEILKRCAVKLTETELNEVSSEPGSSVFSMNTRIQRNQVRLRVAYEQVRLGNAMKADNYDWEAIKHYRMAKEYGIRILGDFAKEDSEAKKLDEEFAVDVKDNRHNLAKK